MSVFEILFLSALCLVTLGLWLIPAGTICETESASPAWTSLFLGPGCALSLAVSVLFLNLVVYSLFLNPCLSFWDAYTAHCLWRQKIRKGLQPLAAKSTSVGFLFAGHQFNQGKKRPTWAAFSYWFMIQKMPILGLLLVWRVGRNWKMSGKSFVPLVLCSLASLSFSFHFSESSYNCLLYYTVCICIPMGRINNNESIAFYLHQETRLSF